MQQCSICLDDLRDGPTLACGHRFHAACLARLAGANGTTPTRRGALTTCPNCRTVSRVALMPVAAFGLGDRVEALYRAAKKQRTERRAAYSAQARDNPCSHYA